MKATGNGSQNKGQYNTRTKHKLSYVSAKMYHIGTSNIEKVAPTKATKHCEF